MKILYLPNAYSQQRQREYKVKIYPILMAMEATYYKNNGHEVEWRDSKERSQALIEATGSWGGYDKIVCEAEGLPFLQLPKPDRKLTRWEEYQDNGNFKFLPATYIQSARDCWYRKCTFCKWATKYPKYETRSVEKVIDEITELVHDYGVKEIFDDSGTFPTGWWLKKFCREMIMSGLAEEVKLGCNIRYGVLKPADWRLMEQAGFRFILMGAESLNQHTLDELNKGIKVSDIVADSIDATKAGLEVHMTLMFGYPWETKEDALWTVKLARYMLRKGLVSSVQASVCSTFKDSPLAYSPQEMMNRVYSVIYHPEFIYRKLSGVRNLYDLKYLWKCFTKARSKL